MSVPTISFPTKNLMKSVLKFSENVHYQTCPGDLILDTLRLGEGVLTDTGALIIHTGEFTGRSPKDKFTVKDEVTENTIHWNEFNIPVDEKYYHIIYKKMIDYLERLPELWVRDCYACADPRYRLNIRVVNEKPWSNLFAYNMFLRPTEEEIENFKPEWHVICCPELKLDAEECGIRQHNVSLVSFKHKMILIAGSGYTGEMKKGIFTILNYILPHEKNVLSMHCSANMGENGDAAIFFGLSGTGKTTLSADPNRLLIGDDEHGWSKDGIFNIEGGCYAKAIDLTPQAEPEIFQALRYGAVLENVVFDKKTHHVDFSDTSITENTLGAYPIEFIRNAKIPCVAGHPTDVIFLTCDAYGILPPVSKLTSAQAMYHYISGYTAKVAGTEMGVTEPQATFSPCFGGPFLVWHPTKYAELLAA